MRSAPFGTIDPASAAIASLEAEVGVMVAPRREVTPRHIVRSGKRAEDTAAGCRANAAADMGRAVAPGGDFMRLRLEHSAAVWTERADLLARLEKNAQRRAPAA